MPLINLDAIRPNLAGNWQPTTIYKKLDLVYYPPTGSSYFYIGSVPKSGIKPTDPLHWQIACEGFSRKLPNNVGRPGQLVRAIPKNYQSSTGSYVMAAIMRDNTVKLAGLLGSSSIPVSSDAYAWVNLAIEPENPPDSDFVQVCLGYCSGYLLTQSGDVYSWGGNGYGQLGHGDTTNRSYATRINFFATNNITVREIIAPKSHYNNYGSVYFICDTESETGVVYGCGYNGNYNLGDGTATQRNTPVQWGSVNNIVKLMCSRSDFPTTVGLRSNGDLYLSGYNGWGTAGDGTTANKQVPTLIQSDVVDFSVSDAVYSGAPGAYQYLILAKSDGTVRGAGYQSAGQLGAGNFTSYHHTFQTAIDLGNIVKVWTSGCGHYANTFALNNSGELFVCGYSIGVGYDDVTTTTNRNIFEKPSIPLPVVDVYPNDGDSTMTSTYIKLSDGSLLTTGQNQDNVCSRDDGVVYGWRKPIFPFYPYTVKQIYNVRTIGSRSFAFLLQDDGQLLFVGLNQYGVSGSHHNQLIYKNFATCRF